MTLNASTIWQCGPVASYASASNINGGGFDASVGGGTDYTDPANITAGGPHVTFDGVTITATTSGVSTTILISGYTVATTDAGNILNLASGTNFTAGSYRIQSVNTGLGTWTLDRNCTSGVGAAMVGRMGGIWADPWTNTQTGTPLVSGNVFNMLGLTGGGSVASPDYTHASGSQITVAITGGLTTSTGGPIRWIGKPQGGASYVFILDNNGYLYAPTGNMWFENIYYWGGATPNQLSRGIASTVGFSNGILAIFKNCKFDQFGNDMSCDGQQTGAAVDCEVFNSITKHTGAGNRGGFLSNADGWTPLFVGCNLHDICGVGIQDVASNRGGAMIVDCIISNCSGDGVVGLGRGAISLIEGNTIDANVGNGVHINYNTGASKNPAMTLVASNMITNAPSGKFGILGDGTLLQMTDLAVFSDYNTYYNNVSGNQSVYPAGTHDVTAGGSPYVAQTTENYQITPALTFRGTAFPTAWLNTTAGTVPPTSNVAPGAVVPQGIVSPNVTLVAVSSTSGVAAFGKTEGATLRSVSAVGAVRAFSVTGPIHGGSVAGRLSRRGAPGSIHRGGPG